MSCRSSPNFGHNICVCFLRTDGIIGKKSVIHILRWSHLGKPESMDNFIERTGWLSDVMKDSMKIHFLNGILNHDKGV